MWECSSNVHWDKHAVQDRLFKLCLLLEGGDLDVFQFSVMEKDDMCEDPKDVFLDHMARLEKRMVVSLEVDDIRREAEQLLCATDFPISELPPIWDKYTPLDVMRAALCESSKPDCSLKEQLKNVHELYWTMKHFMGKLQQVSLGLSCQVSSRELVHAPRVLHQHLESTASSESPDFLHNPSSEPSSSATPGHCSSVGTKCKPCRWHHTSKGCRLAVQCKFCHVCPGEKRPNQKMRAVRRYWAGVRECKAQFEAACSNTKHLNSDASPFWPSEVVQASLNDQQ